MGNYQYDEKYIPPAPKCGILVTTTLDKKLDEGDEKSTIVKMFIDTGADISTIPIEAINELERSLKKRLPYKIVLVEDFDGRKSMQMMYNLKLEVQNGGSKYEHNIDILAVDNSEGVLGRDIINNYILTLNGPELRWSLEK